MKKILTILGAAGLVATTGATVVACGSSEPKDKTPLQKLDEVIQKSWTTLSSTDAENWVLKDKFDLIKETGIASGVYGNKEATDEALNLATLRLEWQINKYQDQNNSEVSDVKKAFSRSLAWATEELSDGIDKNQEAKDTLLKEINKEIEIYNSNKEEGFDTARGTLEQATNVFISVQ